MTSARLALVLVRIPLPGCPGPLPTLSGVATVELPVRLGLDATPAPSATTRQNAESSRANGIPPVSFGRCAQVSSRPAGLFVDTQERASGAQPPVVSRPGAPWIARHLVTPDNPQQFQRL